jgi:hypothetical protein
MKSDGQRTNSNGPQIFRSPECVFRRPVKLDGPSAPPEPSTGIGSSGSAIPARPNRKDLADDDRRAVYRRGVPIEVDA